MTITYRNNDPVSGRWTGIGTDLSPYQIDSNFYECVSRIATLEANTKFTVSISFITISGNDITFHMTDHTTQGPFTIPVSTFRSRGAWQPSTPYLVNDTVSINGTLYLVIFAHTSASTFDPGANDGHGHNYYSAMIEVPGSALPTGGTTGQVLTKSSSADFATTWTDKLPDGGSTGQVLRKASNTSQDAEWGDAVAGIAKPPPSPAGVPGQFLATVDGTADTMEWVTGVRAPPPSPAGTSGFLLATADGTPDTMEWIDPSTIGGTTSLPWSSLTGTPTPAQFRSVLNATSLGNNISGSVNWDLHTDFIYVVTPNGDLTINVPNANRVFTKVSLIIYDFNGSSFTISFGTNFRPGTADLVMSTGPKVYLMEFICDSTTVFELSRTGAL